MSSEGPGGSPPPAPSTLLRQVVVVIALTVVGFYAIRYGRQKELLFGWRLPLALAGVLVFAGGLAVRILAGVGARRARRAGALVTSGVYGVTRNPVYLSLSLMVIGIALTSGTWLAWPWAGFSLVLFLRMAQLEAADLRRRFGDEYEQYARRVPFLIPLLRQRR
jgi:protein-S-isoprenylcysteine O-methyltransferase Ste14